MRLLLDTQVMLWWLLVDPRLGSNTQELLAASPCLVSVASIWEVAIKHRLGKAGGALLPVLDAHVIETAQARVEGLMAVSSDGHWPGYDVTLHRV
jgi:PIN domain nuclease of toxin-antitoxin system